MLESLDKLQLNERTRRRNQSVWVPMDWGGLLSPLAAQQEDMDTLSRPAIENSMAISDESWAIKESQRDRTIEQNQAEIAQEVTIAEKKAATTRAKLAIQSATNEYVLAAKTFDAKVKSLIMSAKEYAAQVELEQLAVEKSRAGLSIAKEGLHLKQVNAQVYYEAIQQAQVVADLARAQVDVAKAHVRAVMADIEAGRADIEVIEAETQKYVAEAEKATLQADVATIYSEILTKQLSAIKLDVGKKEIASGFAYIQSHLDDLLAKWDTRKITEEIRIAGEGDVQTEVALGLLADKAQEQLRETEVDNAQVVFDYEKAQTAENIQGETALQAGLTNARIAVMDKKLSNSIRRDDQETWGQVLVYNAQKAVSGHRTVRRISNNTDFTTLTVD